MVAADRVQVAQLRRQLAGCPAGRPGWRQYEDAALAVLQHLFVPPLVSPHVQSRTLSGLDIRDAVFPNRNVDPVTPWGLLYRELKARMILFEFKNYDRGNIGKEEVDQTRNYMKRTMGKLAVVCCNKEPTEAAVKRRNSVFTEEEKVILFVTTAQLFEMLDMKERGDDPSIFVLDAYEAFLMQYE
jgi:hypothetical protein